MDDALTADRLLGTALLSDANDRVGIDRVDSCLVAIRGERARSFHIRARRIFLNEPSAWLKRDDVAAWEKISRFATAAARPDSLARRVNHSKTSIVIEKEVLPSGRARDVAQLVAKFDRGRRSEEKNCFGEHCSTSRDA